MVKRSYTVVKYRRRKKHWEQQRTNKYFAKSAILLKKTRVINFSIYADALHVVCILYAVAPPKLPFYLASILNQ